MITLKLSYFRHIMRQNSLEKSVMLGKTEGSRKGGRSAMRWTDCIRETISGILRELKRTAEDRQPRTSLAHKVTSGQNQLSITKHTGKANAEKLEGEVGTSGLDFRFN